MFATSGDHDRDVKVFHLTMKQVKKACPLLFGFVYVKLIECTIILVDLVSGVAEPIIAAEDSKLQLALQASGFGHCARQES